MLTKQERARLAKLIDRVLDTRLRAGMALGGDPDAPENDAVDERDAAAQRKLFEYIATL